VLNNNQWPDGQRFVAGPASISEPVSGISKIYRVGTDNVQSWGGWLFDEGNASISANLNPADYPGDDPRLW
jgi:hypothetical protein